MPSLSRHFAAEKDGDVMVKLLVYCCVSSSLFVGSPRGRWSFDESRVCLMVFVTELEIGKTPITARILKNKTVNGIESSRSVCEGSIVRRQTLATLVTST